MMPNRWKTLAFCVGLSVAGLATCADQPNGQLHKTKKVDDEGEAAQAKLDVPALPPAPETPPVVTKEFVMDVPALHSPPEPAKVEVPPAPIALPAVTLELPEPPPVIIPVKATVPIHAAPAVLDQSLIKTEVPAPAAPKPVAEGNGEIKPIPNPASAEIPLATPAFPGEPLKVAAPAPEPIKVEPPKANDRPPAVYYVPPPPPPPPSVELVPVDAKSAVMPVPVPTPATRTEIAPRNPPAVFDSNRLKLIVTLGDGKPRFEVKNIATNKTLLKAEAAAIEISKLQVYPGPNPKVGPDEGTVLQKLLASGPIHFSGPDIEGTCEELSILAGTGEVLLKGNVQMKTLTSKSNWTALQSDKVVYQIGNMPAERTAATR